MAEKGYFCRVCRLKKKEYSHQHPEKADTILHLENLVFIRFCSIKYLYLFLRHSNINTAPFEKHWH